MFKDVIKLITTKKVSNGGGGFETVVDSQKIVFADKKSAKRTEFYLAAQADLQAETEFKISLFDYEDERIIEHEGKFYSVIRTYETGDYIEITCQKRIGGLDEVIK